MSVETEEREDLLADVHELPEVGCQTRLDPVCERRVAWLVVWHCGPTYLVCAHHRQKWLDIMETKEQLHDIIVCHHCGEKVPSDEAVGRFVRFERV